MIQIYSHAETRSQINYLKQVQKVISFTFINLKQYSNIVSQSAVTHNQLQNSIIVCPPTTLKIRRDIQSTFSGKKIYKNLIFHISPIQTEEYNYNILTKVNSVTFQQLTIITIASQKGFRTKIW